MKIKIHNPNNLPTIDYREVEEFQGNLKDLTKDNYARLKKSIEENGFFIPMFLWKHKGKFKVLDAHQRLRVLKKEQATPYEIPYIEIEAKDEKDAKKKLLLISSQYGTITREGLDEFAFDLDTDWMADTLNFDNIFDFDKITEIEEDEYEVPVKIETDIKLGDLFQLGDHRLLCGDATKTEDVERLMDGHKANMVFTDPPYGIGYKYNQYKDISGNKYLSFCELWFNELRAHSNMIFITPGWKYFAYWYSKKPDDVFYWTMKGKHSRGKNCHFRITEQILIWGKTKNKFDFDTFENTNKKQFVGETDLRELHSCPKPIKIIAEIIKAVNKNDLILDVFLGSGTTMIAAEQLNRKCSGMEISTEYCQIIIDRWEKFTNKKVEKIN